MRQYRKIKERYPDTILLFRMGDFFETFEDDALLAAKVLGITLTKRSNGAASEVPLAGFPHHALDNYLPKLVKAGHRVAVCEQLEDPKFSKGIVKRDVIEVVTPGANFSDKILDHKSNNYLAGISIKDDVCGFAFCDVSTGEFFTSEIPSSSLLSQLETINPPEILIPKRDREKILKLLGLRSENPFGEDTPGRVITKVDDWVYNPDYASEILNNHFNTKSLKGFGIEHNAQAVVAAGVVLNYLNETQKSKLSHVKKLQRYDYTDYIILDPSTKRNLEITSSMSDGSREGTLFSILDDTKTPMGARLLKRWISRPLKKVDQIQKRLDAVNELFSSSRERVNLSGMLNSIGDMERLLSKVATGKAVPRDVVTLKNSLVTIADVKRKLTSFNSEAIKGIHSRLVEVTELIVKISSVINEKYLEGEDKFGVIMKGIDSELDDLKDILFNGKNWLEKFQAAQRERTGISSLKVEFNKVFGYYIMVTKTHTDKVPDDYVRKQTLVNAERYITEDLKEYESKILTAEEKIDVIEKRIYNELLTSIMDYTDDIQLNASMIAALDVLTSFAEISSKNKYTQPHIDESDRLGIVDGRHPVIERMLPAGENYIPNDTKLDNSENQILIITGPNMSGKSSYLRQTGLIVLLAQIGCFVPAKSAKIGVVDKIFTRVGASDNIAKGESTFLVEMHEAANILNNCTQKSLLLLDEIGRGTSTYDGISIAWAMTEYLHENSPTASKTLFATHYHELNALADVYPRIKNYRVEVREFDDKVIFLRKINPGTADHSYGIQVAQMAGLPKPVTDRAKSILRSLEDKAFRKQLKDELQISMFEVDTPQTNENIPAEIIDKLESIDINNITPLQALELLGDLVEAYKNKD